MSMQTVKWERITNFTGRNGYFKCSGVELDHLSRNNAVNITALTGKGDVARCDIEVPVEAVPSLIAALQTFAPAVGRFTVIQVNDGRVSGITEYTDKDAAFSAAVQIAMENGADETCETIRAELDEEGEYMPTKHPEWSVAVYESK